jgi:plasmid maintenance system antidote protein VapI
MLPNCITPELFWSKVAISTPDECWIWQGRKPEGYGRIFLDGKTYPAHRIAYELTNGPIPEGLLIRHKCDNPPCCNPAHLLPGTLLDNVMDRVERGRTRWFTGENVYCAKLTDENVAYIREQYQLRQMSQPALARKFGVTVAAISSVVRNKSWKSDTYTYVRHNKLVGRSNITATDAIAIRAEYATGSITQEELGRKFGVSRSYISYLLSGKRGPD